VPVLVIRPADRGIDLGLRRAWASRGLLGELLLRDIRLKYRIGIFGVLWALLQPLALLAAFSLMLGHTNRTSGLQLPYPVYTFAGLILWMLFANGLNGASQSLVTSVHLVGKIYFPRLLLPLAAQGPYLVDFLISASVLTVWLLLHGIHPGLATLWALPAVLVMLMASLSCGLVLSIWLLRFRDIRPLVPFVQQVGMLVTPVAYLPAMLPPGWRAWVGLNPLAPPVNAFRAAMTGSAVNAVELSASLVFWCIVLALVLAYFRRSEERFADYA